MIGPAPDFMVSKYYDVENDCMDKDAPSDLKMKYEHYKNKGRAQEFLKQEAPNVKDPYRAWNGEIIEWPERGDKAWKKEFERPPV